MRLGLLLPLALGACMDVVGPRVTEDMSVAEVVAVEDARASRPKLFQKAAEGPQADPIEPLSVADVDLPNNPDAPVPEAALVDTKPIEPGGLFGLFRRAKAEADAPTDADEKARVLTEGAEGESEVQLASLAPVDEPIDGDPARKVPLAVGFGDMQVACGAKKSAMGTEVAHWPETGAKVFRVYDSAPGSTALRNFHITGFKDRCPRRFQATLVFFGSPSTYEVVRYDPMNRSIDLTATDQAYDKIKRRACGVGPSKPCPANKVEKLDKSVAFLSAYDRFGTVTRWKEILLNDKQVEAVAVKSR